MENMGLAAGIAGIAVLALFRLRQMLRWVRCEPTFLGIAKPLRWGVSYTGQPMPVSFRLPDGTEVQSAVRNYSRGGLPRTGARFQIRYDPNDPERVEWAASVPVLALVIAVLLTALVMVLQRSLRDAGLMV